jgi:LPXTG-site transpeptidase (sortase) family protein
MYGVRLLGCLFALTIALSLAGCGSTSLQHVSPPASPSVHRTAVVETPVFATPAAGAAVNPVRLIIPVIGVNAFIEPLGILSTGNLATPTQSPWEDVGWYNAGPHPGERGSAVIDGHLNRPGNYPAVFWRLGDLHVGDALQVMNTNGSMLHFRVTRIAFYPPQAAPIQDIFGNNGGKYLNLITCAGDWIVSQHQTTLRLVVYTALV